MRLDVIVSSSVLDGDNFLGGCMDPPSIVLLGVGRGVSIVTESANMILGGRYQGHGRYLRLTIDRGTVRCLAPLSVWPEIVLILIVPFNIELKEISPMIENIEAFPDNVVAIIAKGQVTRKDYEQVLIPRVDAALKRHHKVRLYYELGPQFSGIDPGAAWEDLKVGVEHLTRWERMAIVTDVDWIQHMVKAFRFLLPGQLRLFPTANTSEARAWILGTEA